MSETVNPTVQKKTSIQQSMTSKNSRDSRAKRLKRLRRLTQKSRKEFALIYQISQGTLQNWETARFGGLTEKGAHLILAAIRQEKIYCTFEWLMYGAGSGPQKSSVSTPTSTQTDTPNTQHRTHKTLHPNAIQLECDLFEKTHRNILHLEISNDAMLPNFAVGDWVAGRLIKQDALHHLIEQNCIVETEHHGRLLRRIRTGTEPHRYHLIANNAQTTINAPVLYNVKILSAAPAIWIRRKNP